MSSSEYHKYANLRAQGIYAREKKATDRTRVDVPTRRGFARDFDFASLDEAELLHFMRFIVGRGDCVSFTKTSDGGALTTTVIQGGVYFSVHTATPEQTYVKWHDLLESLY